MSRVKFKTMTLSEAARWADDVDTLSDDEFQTLLDEWRSGKFTPSDQLYADLRSDIMEAFLTPAGAVLEPRLPDKARYPIDMEVGIRLLEHLVGRGFTPADAANDDIWRYLSIEVFPDLTYYRYPEPEKAVRERGGRINRKRFFTDTRRIWLKTLWWYVYLSWQGDEQSTRLAIADNGTDMISHFIETPGKGYRIPLYRELMRAFSRRQDKSNVLFRRVTKLNNAECRNIEPGLLPGGVEEYCRKLFAKLDAD